MRILLKRFQVKVDKMSVGPNIFWRNDSAPTLRFRTNFPQKLFFSFFSILSLKERKLDSDHHLKHFWCRKGPNNRWPRSPQTPPFFNTEKKFHRFHFFGLKFLPSLISRERRNYDLCFQLRPGQSESMFNFQFQVWPWCWSSGYSTVARWLRDPGLNY